VIADAAGQIMLSPEDHLGWYATFIFDEMDEPG
jgi:hypothetical protein